MQDQTLLAFDFGTTKIGVAVGQTITETATPVDPLAAKNGIPNWKKLNELLARWQPNAIIVGIPLNMDGSEQWLTQKVREFITQIKRRYKIPVFEIDERLTTIEARQQLFEIGGYKALKEISIDSYAAKIILESWIRANK